MNHQSMSLGPEETTSVEALFQEYAPQGVKYAAAMLSNSVDAEEVVQEAFLRILSAAESTESKKLPVHFQGLFFTTIRNLCIDNIRKQKNNGHLSLAQVDELAANELALPWRSGDQASLEQRLASLLEEMPGDWATAMKLKIEQTGSYQEIATQMNASHAQVRTWIFRARQYLRKHLVEGR